jgi:hypothetical protein
MITLATEWVANNKLFISAQMGFKISDEMQLAVAKHLIDSMENGSPTGVLTYVYSKFLADISAPELTNQEG